MESLPCEIHHETASYLNTVEKKNVSISGRNIRYSPGPQKLKFEDITSSKIFADELANANAESRKNLIKMAIYRNNTVFLSCAAVNGYVFDSEEYQFALDCYNMRVFKFLYDTMGYWPSDIAQIIVNTNRANVVDLIAELGCRSVLKKIIELSSPDSKVHNIAKRYLKDASM